MTIRSQGRTDAAKFFRRQVIDAVRRLGRTA